MKSSLPHRIHPPPSSSPPSHPSSPLVLSPLEQALISSLLKPSMFYLSASLLLPFYLSFTLLPLPPSETPSDSLILQQASQARLGGLRVEAWVAGQELPSQDDCRSTAHWPCDHLSWPAGLSLKPTLGTQPCKQSGGVQPRPTFVTMGARPAHPCNTGHCDTLDAGHCDARHCDAAHCEAGRYDAGRWAL